MTWAWTIAGLIGGGFAFLVLWWLIHIGKTIEQGENFKKRNVELERQAKEKNKFIKDADRLAKGTDALKKKARDAFRRGNVGDLVKVLDEARKDGK